MDRQYTQDEINTLLASGKIKSMTIEAVVIRANGNIEPQGTIAGFHTNIIKNVLLWMKIKYNRIRVLIGR